MNRRLRGTWGSIIAFAMLGILMLSGAAAGANILEKGTFQSIQSKDPVVRIVITRGEHTGVYMLSSMAQVYDGFGKRTTIDTYMVPSEVEFLVEYTAKGPIIKKIREIPQ